MDAAAIEQEIRRGLDFLTTPMRNLPDRHRSMRVVFDYSWQRLSASEQRTLAQLSVFRRFYAGSAWPCPTAAQ
ncbi:MAG: hypothetical protein R2873_29095 [Caldilineaceae bacterium]